MKETSIDYLDCDAYAAVYSTEQRWINRIRKLAAQHPEDVQIIDFGEEGCINALVPKSWVKLSPPIKRNYSDEQRAAMAERLRGCSRGGGAG